MFSQHGFIEWFYKIIAVTKPSSSPPQEPGPPGLANPHGSGWGLKQVKAFRLSASLTALCICGILTARPGGTGAAESAEPCQVREEAAVRWSLWAPPEALLGRIFFTILRNFSV